MKLKNIFKEETMKFKANTMIRNVELEKETVRGCPFCGSRDIELCNTHTAAYWMECQKCGAQVNGTSYADFDDEESHLKAARTALINWNHRA